MDAFFDGLDCRLRVSGMLADSIMMGIVNSAMEEAYRNSCSKEGDLVRLNEKSRFCELATMQLEWCLKFLQEETLDDNATVSESSCDREKLLADLLETRDRIHNRLEETELAIVEKDRELSERLEIESNLRLALEVKDEDITSLHIALGLEREKSKRKTDRGHGLSELKTCVDQQLRRIRGKLEDGQRNLKNLVRRMSSRSLDLDKSIPDLDLDEEGSSSATKDANTKLMREGVESLNLELEFKEMAMDMDILREKIDSSFEMMASSVSLFKSILDEQQWVRNVEKEVVSITTRGFLRDMQYRLNSEHGIPVEDISPVLLDTDWDAFVDDVTRLHSELDKLVTENELQPKCEGGKKLRKSDYSSLKLMRTSKDNKDSQSGVAESDEITPSMTMKEDRAEGFALESPSRRSVAEKIRSHESFLQNRSREIDSRKADKSREKGYSALRSEKSLDSVKEMIGRVNSRVESIIKEKAKLVVQCADPKRDTGKEKQHFIQSCSSESLVVEKEPKVVESTREFPEQSNDSRSCCRSTGAELLEDIKQLKQEKEDLETKYMILEETYAIILPGLMKTLNLEYIDDCNIASHIREDVRKVVVSEMVKEWSDVAETNNIERIVTEEIYNKVISEVVKEILWNLNLLREKCHDEDQTISNSLFRLSHTGKRGNLLREVNSLSNLLDVWEDLELDFNHDLVDPHIYDIVGYEHEESNEHDDALSSVSGRFEKALQQLTSSKTQLREMVSSIGLARGEEDQVSIISCSTQDETNFTSLLAVLEEQRSNLFQFIVVNVTRFSRVIMDFEVIACDKIGENMKRLEDLNHDVAPIFGQVNSIKKQKVLYQNAFTRRCNDLQTAEKEVDLLGDEVDVLYALIEKIYEVLNFYSPVLQQYSEIMDVQRLIWKQLNEESSSMG